jgi:prevent-host-death family protein
MKTMQVREAKTSFSALVEAAEKGEPVVITKHGKEAVMVVPIEEGRKLYPDTNQNFIDFLMTFPGGIEFERDETPLREVAL